MPERCHCGMLVCCSESASVPVQSVRTEQVEEGYCSVTALDGSESAGGSF
jgi:hypothetical protein